MQPVGSGLSDKMEAGAQPREGYRRKGRKHISTFSAIGFTPTCPFNPGRLLFESQLVSFVVRRNSSYVFEG